MNAVTVDFILVTVVASTISVLRDPWTRRHPGAALRSVAALRRNPWLGRTVRRRIRDYQRTDFHPDDHDAGELLEHWRGELFGEDGRLLDRLAATG